MSKITEALFSIHDPVDQYKDGLISLTELVFLLNAEGVDIVSIDTAKEGRKIAPYLLLDIRMNGFAIGSGFPESVQISWPLYNRK
jgi:hypothetical protein